MSKMSLLRDGSQHIRNSSHGSLEEEEDEEDEEEEERDDSPSKDTERDAHPLQLPQSLSKWQSTQSEPVRPKLSNMAYRTVGESSNGSIRRASTSSDWRKSRPNGDEELRNLHIIARESLEGRYESAIDGKFVGGPGMHVAEGIAFGLESRASDNSEHDSKSLGTRSPRDEQNADNEDPLDNSPYPQVRASVSAIDDTTLSINTPRMWTLSLLFAIMGSATNLFFSLRYPSVTITPVIALLLVHPLGLLWDQFLKRSKDPPQTFFNGSLSYQNDLVHPCDEIREEELPAARDMVPLNERHRILHSLRLWLAQGQWNEKEHACVYISSNVSFGFAFATDVIVEQTQFYKQDATVLYQILLILSTQILGYAIAGLTRRYLVQPSGMIWPANLMATTMFTTLHKEENKPANGWFISRWNFFMIIFLSSFAFYFLPGLFMPALSYFNVVTWIAPSSVIIANLFGVSSGLGLFPMTFDWSQIAYIGSPLLVPFWAALNVVGGLIIVMWVMAPIMYYFNTLYTAYMPILSSYVFDNKAAPYNVSKILTSDFLFDKEAYQNYSPVFLPITYVLSYALQFAAVAALFTHTVCWHGKDVWRQWRKSLHEMNHSQTVQHYDPVATSDEAASSPNKTSAAARETSNLSRRLAEPELDQLLGAKDVHNRLMRRYNDVPASWYLLTGLITTAVGIFVVEYYPVHLPWYGLILALGLTTALFIPIGIVMATTNQQSSLYLICQLVCGAVFPGRGIANMIFVTYGYITSTQGMKFSSDLKLGHYMKIPPRLLFAVQMVATIVASFTQLGTLNWMLHHIPGICTPEALNGFTCPIARVHFNGSILWGVIGPSRFFGTHALYRPLVWAFLGGAIAPLIVWHLGKGRRSSKWQKVNMPIVFGSLSWIPPATGLNFSVWAIVCFIFNHLVRRSRGEWWRKYNFTLSAALDAGVACGVAVVFFGVVYPGWMKGFSWWGTEIYKLGCDWRACAYKEIPDGGRFGPDQW